MDIVGKDFVEAVDIDFAVDAIVVAALIAVVAEYFGMVVEKLAFGFDFGIAADAGLDSEIAVDFGKAVVDLNIGDFEIADLDLSIEDFEIVVVDNFVEVADKLAADFVVVVAVEDLLEHFQDLLNHQQLFVVVVVVELVEVAVVGIAAVGIVAAEIAVFVVDYCVNLVNLG